MLLTVDRTEENIILMQNSRGEFFHFPITCFDTPPRDGDVYFYTPGVSGVLVKDEDLTKIKKERAKSRLEALLARE